MQLCDGQACCAGVRDYPEASQGSCSEAPPCQADHSCRLHPEPLEVSPSCAGVQQAALSQPALASLGEAVGGKEALQAHQGCCCHLAGLPPAADITCILARDSTDM